MFWRGRKRKDAAWRVTTNAVEKEATTGPTQPASDDETPEPTTSGEDTEHAAMMKEEEESEYGEDDQKSAEELHDSPEEAPRAPMERELTPEERLERKRQDAMQTQKVLETQALARDSFCKNQRVQYTHRASGRKYEAVVVAVHFDDGVDRPYFTIRYEMAGDPPEVMEKQTTSLLQGFNWHVGDTGGDQKVRAGDIMS